MTKMLIAEEKITVIRFSADTMLSVIKFIEKQLEKARSGGIEKHDWEESRSYAVEAIVGMLRDNPEVFSYAKRMEEYSSRERTK